MRYVLETTQTKLIVAHNPDDTERSWMSIGRFELVSSRSREGFFFLLICLFERIIEAYQEVSIDGHPDSERHITGFVESCVMHNEKQFLGVRYSVETCL